MISKYFVTMAIISVAELFAVSGAVMAKAACELKQLVTAPEFETLQEKWKVENFLPSSPANYQPISPDDEISFYDKKSTVFKDIAILRWRKSDRQFTIKNRSGTGNVKGAACQLDYISKISRKISCQYDHNSAGPFPSELRLSKTQKDFLDENHLKWEATHLFQLGPIRSYQTHADPSICRGVGDKSPIEFESWLMQKGDRKEMVYEVSIKVKDADKCAARNEAFRSCLSKTGVNINKNRGTKTEAVYEFFQP
ncbi:MAG: hypothetical protein PHG00_08420 [Methylococcales bacterium]|nr:hypothetical protein [Methylococcales bacterium]